MQRQFFVNGGAVVVFASIVIIYFLFPAVLLRDPILLAAVSIFIGMRASRCVKNTRWQRGIGLFVFCILIAAAWFTGYGVMHSADQFFIPSTIPSIAVMGLCIGWMLAATKQLFTNDDLSVIQQKWSNRNDRRQWRAHWPLVVLIGAALFFALFHISDINFQNDEYYHVEAAQGFLKTGKPVLWDFAKDAPKISSETGKTVLYDRAFLYTLQVAASVKIFGWSEWAARLPSVVWYVALVVCFYILSFFITQKRSLALIGAFAVISFDHVMLYGRIVRMYSMTMVLALGMIVLFYVAYSEWTKPIYSRKRLAILFVSLSVVSLVAVSVHLITIIIPLAFAVFLIVETGLSIFYNDTFYHSAVAKRIRYITGFGIVAFCISFLVLTIMRQPIAEYFVGLRHSANSNYFFLPFQDFPIPVAGLVLWVASCIAMWRKRMTRYTTVIVLCIMYVFVYGVTRYAAPRYVSFLLPVIVFQIAWFLWMLLSDLCKNSFPPRVAQGIVASVCILIAVPVVSGAYQWNGIVQMPRYERIHANGYGHDFSRSYEFIRQRIVKDAVVMTIDFRSYYWQNDNQLVIELPKGRELTLEQWKQLLRDNPQAWIVLPKKKWHHLKKGVQNYLLSTGESHSIEGSNMFIFFMTTP